MNPLKSPTRETEALSMNRLRDLLIEIAEGYAEYRQETIVNKDSPVYARVTQDLPSLLRQITSTYPNKYLIKGSTGQGNITPAPWIATFDQRITKSATNGYYPVYLFSILLDRVYLSIAQGVTSFKVNYKGERVFEELLKSGKKLASCIDDDSKDFILGKIDLNANGNNLHKNYEFSNIVAIEYSFVNLPDEATLIDDYRRILSTYQQIIENPVTPDMEALADESVLVRDVSDPLIKAFMPRKIKQELLGGKTNSSSYRRSKESKKVGNVGEEIVYRYECKRLMDCGLTDLASQVDWLAKRNECPGWDITSYDSDGSPIYIEVKSSKTDRIDSINITRNEMRAMIIHSNRYFIYLVKDVFSDFPEIEVLQNPMDVVETERLRIRPIAFNVSLVHGSKDALLSEETLDLEVDLASML